MCWVTLAAPGSHKAIPLEAISEGFSHAVTVVDNIKKLLWNPLASRRNDYHSLHNDTELVESNQ